jgi:TonB family protein
LGLPIAIPGIQFPETPFFGRNPYPPAPLRNRIRGVRFLVPLVWALSFTGLALAQQQTSNPATDISAITVDRKGCFGSCPRYTLTIRREGRSTIVGRTGPWQGPYTATQVSAADFDQLRQAIAKIRFFDLPDVVGPWPEDTEVVAVTVTTGEKSKTVTTHDLQEAPASFVGILTLAEGVMAKLQWRHVNDPEYGVVGPFPLRRVEPQYTEEARKARLQGSVILEVEVRPDGTVDPDSITVIQGLGMGLDEKAIEAVRQWTFKPAYKDGKPMGVAMPVAFQLEFRL